MDAYYTSPPVLECVIDNGFQNQTISNLGRASEVKHVYGPQSRMSIA